MARFKTGMDTIMGIQGAVKGINRRGMMMGWDPLGNWGRRSRYCADRLKGVDIDAEYELIKQKKSKLPRALRDRVVALYAKRTD